MPVLHQGEQPLEIGFGQAVFLQHVSHMVDHEVDLERAEEIDQVANDISGSVELKVPAIGGDLRYHRGNISLDLLKRKFRALEQIKTNATHTGVCVIAHCLRSEEHTSELQSLM